MYKCSPTQMFLSTIRPQHDEQHTNVPSTLKTLGNGGGSATGGLYSSLTLGLYIESHSLSFCFKDSSCIRALLFPLSPPSLKGDRRLCVNDGACPLLPPFPFARTWGGLGNSNEDMRPVEKNFGSVSWRMYIARPRSQRRRSTEYLTGRIRCTVEYYADNTKQTYLYESPTPGLKSPPQSLPAPAPVRAPVLTVPL